MKKKYDITDDIESPKPPIKIYEVDIKEQQEVDIYLSPRSVFDIRYVELEELLSTLRKINKEEFDRIVNKLNK